ncbi:MAG: tetratricopeptide repeat protein [Candidatus Thalassarchaeaceae archaeon]|nr:tetratricopeptide repeat protein [Candidatus Thalassarchaeaceae archaeon]
MDPVTIGLTLFFAAATSAVIWWLVQAEVGIRRLREDLETAHAETSHVLASLNARTEELADSALALQRAHPGLAGIIDAHRTIDRLQSTLAGAGESGEARAAATTTLSAVKGLLATREGDGDLENTIPADPGLLTLLTRVLQTLDQLELTVDDLTLTEIEARRLGEISFLAGDREWATACYTAASSIAPGQAATLRSLCRLTRESGEDEKLRQHLEGLLDITPDEPTLLREHARLLTKSGDAGAEKDLRRLEALGVETAEDKSMMASLAARAGDTDVALSSIEEALASDPNHDDWLRKAELHLARNERGLGITAIDEAIALDRQSGPAWTVRARLLKNEPGRLEEALKAVVHAVALGEAQDLLKAELLEQLGRSEEAHSSLSEALEKEPANAEIRAQLVLLQHQAGNPEAAFEILAEAPAGAWEGPALHLQKGRLILAEADRYRDGTGDRDRELLSEADLAFEAALGVDRESGVGWLGKARIQRMLKDYSEAQISLARARRLLPDEPLIAAEEALLALDGNDVEAASRLIAEAHVLERDSLVIDYVKGVVAARRGDLIEAKRLFDSVLLEDPNHVRARLNRCTTLMIDQDHHAALDDVQFLLEAHPELDLARLRRGEIMLSLGEWEEAESNFRDVLSRRGKNPHALIQLGASLVAQERLTEAEQPLNEAIRLDGDSAEGWYQRGLLYVAFGQFDGALSDFETASKLNRHHMNALLRIAAIHHENEDWDDAEAAWRNVLNVEPENRVARRRIQDAIDGQSRQKKAEVLTTSRSVEAAVEEPTEEESVEIPFENDDEDDDEGAPDEDTPDFEFGFGTL